MKKIIVFALTTCVLLGSASCTRSSKKCKKDYKRVKKSGNGWVN